MSKSIAWVACMFALLMSSAAIAQSDPACTAQIAGLQECQFPIETAAQAKQRRANANAVANGVASAAESAAASARAAEVAGQAVYKVLDMAAQSVAASNEASAEAKAAAQAASQAVIEAAQRAADSASASERTAALAASIAASAGDGERFNLLIYGGADVSFLALHIMDGGPAPNPKEWKYRFKTDGDGGSFLGFASKTRVNPWLQAAFRTELGINMTDGSGSASKSPGCTVSGASGATCAVSLGAGVQGLMGNRETWVGLYFGQSDRPDPKYGPGFRHRFLFGRFYSPVFANQAQFSAPVFGAASPLPWANAGMGTNAVRSNGLTYISPAFGRLSGMAVVGVGELNSWNGREGNFFGFRLAYDHGAITGALATQITNLKTGDILVGNAAVKINFGAFSLAGMVQQTRQKGPKSWEGDEAKRPKSWEGKYAQLYATYKLPHGLLMASVGWLEVRHSAADSGLAMLGYRHYLSEDRKVSLYGKGFLAINQHEGVIRPVGSDALKPGEVIVEGQDATGGQTGITYSF